MMEGQNGKGDAPRVTQDPEKYEESWERIFGKIVKDVDSEDDDG